MIYSLEGTLIKKTLDLAVVSCGGVGFEVNVPQSVYANIGETGERVFLFTSMIVKEDGMDLYGFVSEEQKDCFELLITVSGVGPRAALSILSIYTPEKVAAAIARGDYEAFRACSGIGPKIAQRITLELKNRVSAADIAGPTLNGARSEAADAVSALVSLGFTQNEAAAAVAKLPAGASAEEMIRFALGDLNSRRG